jgi:hypothetical protein
MQPAPCPSGTISLEGASWCVRPPGGGVALYDIIICVVWILLMAVALGVLAWLKFQAARRKWEEPGIIRLRICR